MELNEAFKLMRDIRRAEANPKTCVGAAKQLGKHLDHLVVIGAKDGEPALVTSCLEAPSEWNGFPVVIRS